MAQFRRGRRRRKVCYFTTNKITKIDYKDVDLLKRFVSDRENLPRRTRTSAKYQRELTVAIKRARHMALLLSLLNSNNTLFTEWRGLSRHFFIKHKLTFIIRQTM